MKKLTDNLCAQLNSLPEVNWCGVVDSGSRETEISELTFVGDRSNFTIKNGLRPNKGFNLGITKWAQSHTKADWLLLLPNDNELVNWKAAELLRKLNSENSIACAVPVSPNNPYIEMLPKSRIGLAWNFHEGPILLKSNFVLDRIKSQSNLFDQENFRGYLSFIELTFQIYACNSGIVATDLISFTENQSHTILNYELISTEQHSDNLKLLLIEGEKWLMKKYGIKDRWTFELVTRLLFEEFIKVNPNLSVSALV
jgi:hypothetical protein